jgi:hypothetical protein
LSRAVELQHVVCGDDVADEPSIADKERERIALLEEVSRIVAAGSAQGRELTAQEDSRVLSLMVRVRALEEETHYALRHERID